MMSVANFQYVDQLIVHWRAVKEIDAERLYSLHNEYSSFSFRFHDPRERQREKTKEK